MEKKDSYILIGGLGIIAALYFLMQGQSGDSAGARWEVGDVLLCGQTQWEVREIQVFGELYYLLGIVGSTYSDWYKVRIWDKLSCQKIN